VKTKRILKVSIVLFMLIIVSAMGSVVHADSLHEGWLWPTTPSYRHLSRGFHSSHSGIDITVSTGSPVYASKDGTVLMTYTGCNNDSKKYSCSSKCSPNCGVYSGNGTCNWGYGNGVIIKHADGSISMYAHMSSVSVSKGASVGQGQLIGYSGSTGNSTGAHLHFELGSSYTVSGTYYKPSSYNNNPRSADYQVTANNQTNLSVSNGYVYNTSGVGYIFTSDTQAPTISNVRVTDVSADRYKVTCTVTDNVGVTRVAFPTWTEPNGQDDLGWIDGEISGNTATIWIYAVNHNNERECNYITHIYAYDAAGNWGVANTDQYSELYIYVPAAYYTITLDPSGGTVSKTSLPVKLNSSDYFEISWCLPTREGYEFEGWYTSPSGGTQVYNKQGYCTNEGQYWANNYYIYRGNVTLYAHWCVLRRRADTGAFASGHSAATTDKPFNQLLSVQS